MKSIYLLIPLLFASSAQALTPEDKEAKEICGRHVKNFQTYYSGGIISYYPQQTVSYDTGFAVCEKIIAKITEKENKEEVEKAKADLEKIAKYATDNNCD